MLYAPSGVPSRVVPQVMKVLLVYRRKTLRLKGELDINSITLT